VGMRRRGMSSQTINTIKKAHRRLFREHKSLDKIHDLFLEELDGIFPYELSTLLTFVKQQRLGRIGRAREGIRDQQPPADQANETHRRAA